MKRSVWGSLIGLFGFGLTGFAVFANRFGFDKENDWENGRVSVLVVGCFFLAIELLVLTSKLRKKAKEWISKPIRSALQTWKTRWGQTPVAHWISTEFLPVSKRAESRVLALRPIRYLSASRERQATLTAILLGLGIILIYIWYVSMGFWTEWPTTTTYYNKLAEAFQHGQVNLLIEPSPGLSSSPDPYNIENRQGFAYLWDAVFYNGQYFLYWGPAPALGLTLVRLLYSGEVGDQIIAFLFLCSAFLVNVALLLKLRSRLFPGLRWLWLVPAILTVGLTNPLPWMLNRPAVYEASVAGGQFFLSLGLYLAFSYAAENQPAQYWKPAMAGASLALAAASRTSLLPSLLFLFIMLAWHIWKRPDLLPRRKGLALGALGFPFAAGMAGLGWYNQIRFGSVLEFGLRYQLSTHNLNAIYDSVFSWANIPINLYNYLFNPFQVNAQFPYIRTFWTSHFIVYPIPSPANYYLAEPVSGLLFNTPYVLLAGLAVFFLLRTGMQILRRKHHEQPSGNPLLLWTLSTLSGVSLLAFGPLLFFFSATMRYLADAVPAMILLATLGSWVGNVELIQNQSTKKRFALLVAVLVILTVTLGLLLGIGGMDNRLEKVNPALYYRLVEILSFK